MTTLFNIYEGAVENSDNKDVEINAAYFVDEYSFLDEEQVAMLVRLHCADQNS